MTQLDCHSHALEVREEGPGWRIVCANCATIHLGPFGNVEDANGTLKNLLQWRENLRETIRRNKAELKWPVPEE